MEAAEQAWYLTHSGLSSRDVARRLGVTPPQVFQLLDVHAPVARAREERLAKGFDGQVSVGRSGPKIHIVNIGQPRPKADTFARPVAPVPPSRAERWRLGPKSATAMAAALDVPVDRLVAAIRAAAISTSGAA